MSREELPELAEELLDDFFTECDEHLTQIRESLVQLEGSVDKAQADLVVVEALFRNFHSFKGISAIVGLRVAEELAHAAEDFLRKLRHGHVILTSGGLNLLMQATQRLEQIVGAFRARRALPTVEDLVRMFENVAGEWKGDPHMQAKTAPTISADPPVAEATHSLTWKFSFTPTKELDARGVNINTVRARLAKLGDILKAIPQVRPGGRLEFEFFVALSETPANVTDWETDGIIAELVEQTVAAPQSSPANEAHNPFIAPSHVVRVDLPRLDNLMRIVGEMVIKRSRFEEELNRSGRKSGELDNLREVNAGFARSLRELREAIMRVRMVPVAEIFARMPFVVRDLARESRKKARLVLEGQRTELDKYLIEQLKDSLLHLVRNSFSHGVETPEERSEAGKPPEATITLTAETIGDMVMITVCDDGQGVDRKAVAQRARELGLLVPDLVDNAALLEILCLPGFSTRSAADFAAGRGVGMSVVQSTVRALGGTLALETEERKGSRFILRVPLTLAIADTFIVSAANETCAVPQSFVTEVLAVVEDDVQKVNGVEVIRYRNGILPVVRLATFFRKTGAKKEMVALVLRSDRGSSGLLVDRIHGHREVVVRPIRDPLIQTPGIAGATELGDGKPVLILDGTAFTAGAVRPNEVTPSLMRN